MQQKSPEAITASCFPAVEDPSGCKVATIAFDFTEKVEKPIPLSEAKAAMEGGKFIWTDIDVDDADSARKVLASLGLVADEIIEDALTREPATQTAKYEDYLHIVLSGCRLTDRHFDLERVDIIVGQRFLLTIHKGSPIFLNAVKKHYRSDFYRFAKSPSFLIYELWDQLIDNYLSVQKRFEERVERLQTELIGEVDDRVFERVSEIGADLLHFRKVLLPARSVLNELSSRRTLFISEATQPFLANMAGTVERVLQDLLVDRDILSESLELYMSKTSYRTNRVMNKLTIVSVIFLPLSFLCGVYGMNFDVLPELHWKYGYLLFWCVVLALVGGIFALMRRNRLL